MNPVKKLELLLKPTYEFDELEDGFVCICKVLGHTVCGDMMPNKTKAKQSSAEKMFDFCQFQFYTYAPLTPTQVAHHPISGTDSDADMPLQYVQMK